MYTNRPSEGWAKASRDSNTNKYLVQHRAMLSPEAQTGMHLFLSMCVNIHMWVWVYEWVRVRMLI